MTLPTVDFAFIDDSSARALYGCYHPKMWCAVEAYLLSNETWAQDMFERSSEQIAAAIYASWELNRTLGQSDPRVAQLSKSAVESIEAYAQYTELSQLDRLALEEPFEVALFGTLVKPEASDSAVISEYLAWKKDSLIQASREARTSGLMADPCDLLAGQGKSENYWSDLCHPCLELPGDVDVNGQDIIDINFDDLT